MKEGLKGIKNFEDDTEYYRFYLKECESANIKLIEEVRRYKKALEEISRQYENTSVNRALEIAKEALKL